MTGLGVAAGGLTGAPDPIPAVVPRRNAQVGDDAYLHQNIAFRGNFNVNAPC